MEAMRQLAKRERARRGVGPFTEFVSPWYEPAAHLSHIDKYLDLLVAGEIKRLMFFCPPRHGKSEKISVHLPAYYLGRHPDHRVIHASYAESLSNLFSRRVRNLIENSEEYHLLFPETMISPDSRSVSQWNLAGRYRGGFLSVGVGTGVTGHNMDLGIIDDPVKGAEAAASKTQMDALFEWFQGDFMTRIYPWTGICLMHTRWSDDDLAGRILNGPTANEWTVVNLPAFAGTEDPLGRLQGEALWPERYPVDVLNELAEAVGSRNFAALYQQSPVVAGGNEFQSCWFEEEYTRLPRQIERVITFWDTALKDGEENDEWAGFTLAVGKDGIVYWLNLSYGHFTAPEAETVMVGVARRTRRLFGSDVCRNYIEDKVSGTVALQYMAKDHPDLVFSPFPVNKSKLARARSIEPFCEARRSRPPAGSYPWKEALLGQLLAFPYGSHDDRVDAFVGAHLVAIEGWTPSVSLSGAKGKCKRPKW